MSLVKDTINKVKRHHRLLGEDTMLITKDYVNKRIHKEHLQIRKKEKASNQ